MSKQIDAVVKSLVDVQAWLTGMSTEERMIVGERVATELRRSKQIEQSSRSDRPYQCYFSIDTEALDLNIKCVEPASQRMRAEARASETPFPFGLTDADIPF